MSDSNVPVKAQEEQPATPAPAATEATTTTNNNAEPTGEKKHNNKRKFAVVFGYVGEQYFGLQYNRDPTHPSIEETLLKAFNKAGLVADENMQGPVMHKLGWQRASRTDKGVHALRNILSVKLIQPDNDDIPAAIAKTNSFLPKDIRIFDMQQVTKSFNAKLYCGGRRYEYYLPTFALMKLAEYNDIFSYEEAPEEPDMSLLAEDKSDDENAGGDSGGDDDDEMGDEEGGRGGKGGRGGRGGRGRGGRGGSNNNKRNRDGETKEGESEKKDAEDVGEVIRAEPGTRCPNPDDHRFHFKEVNPEVMKKLSAYRISPDQLERTRKLFALYEGTIPFHNFTPQGRASDRSTIRHLRSVKVSDPFVQGYDAAEEKAIDESDEMAKLNVNRKEKKYNSPYDLEWVCIELVGQSFMLNQIRKMIGCVSSILVGGIADLEEIPKEWLPLYQEEEAAEKSARTKRRAKEEYNRKKELRQQGMDEEGITAAVAVAQLAAQKQREEEEREEALPPTPMRVYMKQCLSTKVQRGMPMAPANGLFLVDLTFERYNYRLEALKDKGQKAGNHGPKSGLALDDKLTSHPDALFIRRRVLQCVMRREVNEDITGRWMRGMRYINRLAWGVTKENRLPIVRGPPEKSTRKAEKKAEYDAKIKAQQEEQKGQPGPRPGGVKWQKGDEEGSEEDGKPVAAPVRDAGKSGHWQAVEAANAAAAATNDEDELPKSMAKKEE